MEIPTNNRVLVIDDNRAIHDDFRKILCPPKGASSELGEFAAELFGASVASSPRASFEVESAFQGREGFECVKAALEQNRPFAMAFIDVRMPPGWDGIETVEHIWSVDPDLQVVICTAYSDYSWDVMMQRLGQSDRLVILKKPFETVEALQLASALTAKWALGRQAREHLKQLEEMVSRRTDQLRKSEERFRLIAENAADLIGIVDESGRPRYRSPSFQRLLGHGERDLGRADGFDHVHPDDRSLLSSAIARTIHSGTPQVVEYRVRHQDGSWRTLESHLAPFRDSSGATQTALFVARDVTERKEAAAAQSALELQLRHAQKLESIGRLAAGIAHEINTPTQFIRDNTCFLRDAFKELLPFIRAAARPVMAGAHDGGAGTGEDEPESAGEEIDFDFLLTEIPKAIEQCLEGLEHTARIVLAMKGFSHPGTTKIPTDLNQAIESTVTLSRNEWKYVAEIETDFDPTLPPVPAIPGELNQVVLNLIVNASDAIADALPDRADKGTITISTRHDERWAEIRISDTGGGIPEHARERIFEPFFTTKPVGRGTGQGLAISRSVIVNKHGGTLTFQTETGRGTTFVIRLPLAESADAGKHHGNGKAANR